MGGFHVAEEELRQAAKSSRQHLVDQEDGTGTSVAISTV